MPGAQRARERLPRASSRAARGVVDRARAAPALRRARRARPASACDPDARVGALRTAEQQKVEILRAIARDARLILMDEPTAALTADEIRAAARRRARRSPPPARRSCSSPTTSTRCSRSASDGHRDARRPRRAHRAGRERDARSRSSTAMVGRAVEHDLPGQAARRRRRAGGARGARALARARGRATCRSGARRRDRRARRASSAAAAPRSRGCSSAPTALDAGEIVPRRRASCACAHPRDAARHGIAMVPESRKEEGLLMMRSIRENATLATLPRFTRGRRRASAARSAATRRSSFDRLDVRAPGTSARVGQLCRAATSRRSCSRSGSRSSRGLLIADEPTRGIDVAAKREIHGLIAELAAERHGRAADLVGDRGGARARAPRARDARRPGRRGARPATRRPRSASCAPRSPRRTEEAA